MIYLKKGQREVFWDNYLIDEEKTTAKLTLNHPHKREIVSVFEDMWEGDSCGYYTIFKDGDIYRMYYIAIRSKVVFEGEDNMAQPIYACYAESCDGLKWTKPNLGIVSLGGITENNIIMDDRYGVLDCFFVFKDENPECPESEKYKAVVRRKTGKPGLANDSLWCYVSSDAIHFDEGWCMHSCGAFDSLNTAMWDERAGKYRCWFRGFHDPTDWCITAGKRDIRYMESTDFKNWSEEVRIDIHSPYDFQLYTNHIGRYYRVDNIFIGFPTRYIERKEWTDNYEQLCGKEKRKLRMKNEARIGLALTDCMFMTSRDGVAWERFDEEPFLRSGMENGINWVYGDSYPAYGMIETETENGEKELSIYVPEGQWTHTTTKLWRYTIRLDGFASFKSGFEQKKIVTKPFTFEGEQLEINFSTSAAGGVYINFLDEDGNKIEGYESCEYFGDTISRKINFEKSLSELNGKSVRMEILLSDADIYSFVIN